MVLEVVKLELKIIHVIRNPYDNISTMLRWSRPPGSIAPLVDTINIYFKQAATNARIRKDYPEKVHQIKHEDFINDPAFHLKRLCQFLGVDASDDYLSDCTSIVYKKPNRSRYEFQWKKDLIDMVEKKSACYDFLRGYSYYD